jgi:hypothetical protein
MWQQWINAFLGIWVLITPFFNWTRSGLVTNLVITGIVIAILGFWGAASSSTYPTTQPMAPQAPRGPQPTT